MTAELYLFVLWFGVAIAVIFGPNWLRRYFFIAAGAVVIAGLLGLIIIGLTLWL